MPIIFKAMAPSSLQGPQPPGAPGSLNVTGVTNSSVSLSWSSPTPAATSYNLYRNNARVRTGIVGNTVSDTGLTPSTSYMYFVTGVNAVGEGPASNTVTATTNASGHQYKFFPSHGMLSNGIVTFGSNPLTVLATEMTALLDPGNTLAKVYRANYRWTCFENATPGPPYNYAQLDSLYTKVTGISAPGQTGNGNRLAISWETITNYASTNPTNTVPAYMLNNPIYGPGTNGTQFGYWSAGSACGPTMWRPNTMTRYNLLMADLAQHILPSGFTTNDDPFFDHMQSWEITAPTVGGMDYSDSTYITQCQNWASQMMTVFPNTIYLANNNYVGGNNTACSGFTTYLFNHRGGITSPDCFGLTAILDQGGWGTGMTIGGTLTIGYRAYIGSTLGNNTGLGTAGTNFIPAGLPDRRGSMPCVVNFESPEVQGNQFLGYGTPYTPLNFYNNAAEILSLPSNGGGAHQLLYCFIGAPYSAAVENPTNKRNTGTNPGNWGSFLTMMAANPTVPSTVYPSNLP